MWVLIIQTNITHTHSLYLFIKLSRHILINERLVHTYDILGFKRKYLLLHQLIYIIGYSL